MSKQIVERLDTLIETMKDVTAASARHARIAHVDPWLDAEEVGGILGYAAAQVRERLACKPGFPTPLRIEGGHPRWRASEIEAWALEERERTGGRKRKRRNGVLTTKGQQ